MQKGYWPRRGVQLILVLVLLGVVGCAAQHDGRAASWAAAGRCAAPNLAIGPFDEAIRSAPAELREAIQRFPKGADLHNHLSGAIMPEEYLAMGISEGVCYGADPYAPAMLTIRPNSGEAGRCQAGDAPLAQADAAARQRLVASLSMHDFPYGDIQSGHDQFFAVFGRIGTLSHAEANKGRMLAALLRQAEKDTVSHVETMLFFQDEAVNRLAETLRQRYPEPGAYAEQQRYATMYRELLSAGLAEVVAAASQEISKYERQGRAILQCGTLAAEPACGVSLAFVGEISRNAARGQQPDLARIFAQTAFAFLLAHQDERVVGVNLVGGEDMPVSMGNFQTEMGFLRFFKTEFPSVGLALHAGELTPCFVGADNPALQEHIRGSLAAGATRIGHAVSFAFLPGHDQAELATLFKEQQAVVEVLFTSNAQILGVGGKQHPFPLFLWQYGLPVVLATDDGGVSHSSFSDAWVYGYQYYPDFDVQEMVRLARTSLQSSFLSGAPLWRDIGTATPIEQCVGVELGSPRPPEPCRSFLAKSRKAAMQWRYEARLAKYQQQYGRLISKAGRRAAN